MYRARKAAAVLCIVALIFVAVLPGFAGAIGCAVLVVLWIVLPPTVSAGTADDRALVADQPVSLLALLPSRAPPAALPLA